MLTQLTGRAWIDGATLLLFLIHLGIPYSAKYRVPPIGGAQYLLEVEREGWRDLFVY